MSDEGQTPELGPLELTTLLLRHHRIHAELWTLKVRFKTAGLNAVAAGSEEVVPSVLVGVQSVQLHRVAEPDGLTVDAAAVNPRGQAGKGAIP